MILILTLARDTEFEPALNTLQHRKGVQMGNVLAFPAKGAGDNTERYVGNLPIPLCTVGEFAFVTGLSDQTIRRCIHAGELPSMRVGHRLFIRTDKLLEEEAANGR